MCVEIFLKSFKVSKSVFFFFIALKTMLNSIETCYVCFENVQEKFYVRKCVLEISWKESLSPKMLTLCLWNWSTLNSPILYYFNCYL